MHIAEESAAASNEREEDGDMGAYLEAMRGEDGHTRDSKGKARFNKTQGKRARGNDEDDVAVTEGLRELEVGGGGGGKNKKVKRETVRIGAEFKAKVRSRFTQPSPVLPSHAPLSAPTLGLSLC